MILRNKDKEKLIQIFSEEKEKFEVLAYGSRVNGDAYEGSDLDLVIRKFDGKPYDFSDLSNIKKKIYDTTIPILVELRDWYRLPESFHEQINRKNEVLFRS